MNREERREKILKMIGSDAAPIPGSKLAELLGVSRQVIVQDIAILRVDNKDILSTNRGYILNAPYFCRRVFKVHHSDAQIEDELNTIVDAGGKVLDVFVEHNVYGKIKADLLISTRLDVKEFVANFNSKKVSPLKNLTFDYHFHTVEAASEEILNIIEKDLMDKNYIKNKTVNQASHTF